MRRLSKAVRALAMLCAVAGPLCAVTGAAVSVPAMADPVADFYRGKTVRIVIGYGPGSGYDTYGRLVERHIGRHIPGNPDVIAQNMDGAGSLRATNFLYNAAPKDGTTIGIIGRGLAIVPLVASNDGAKFDGTKFIWLGSVNNEVSVAVAWRSTGIRTIDDARRRELMVGATGQGVDDTSVFPGVANAIIGTRFKWVSGYRSGNEINLAMERGEVAGRVGWSWSSIKATKPDWLRDGKIHLLMQLSLHKHPELPDVPLIMDFAKNSEERRALELVFARQAMGRPFLAPPGVPGDRAAALKRAFDSTMKDAAFLGEAERMQLEINPVSGEEVQAIVARMYNAPKSVIDLVKRIVPPT
jgi:tripartite-type tricarboxylate transporter receptor subunit TctC